MADKTYTSDDIEVLTDAEHCRRRTNIYLGNMNVTSYDIPVLSANTLTIQSHSFIPAVYKAVGEIIDNATDEFSQITTKNKTLTITAEPLIGKYTVSDNGRGVPVDKHVTGKYTPEVVFGSLRSGRNFNDDSKVSGTIGTNGDKRMRLNS